MEGKQSSDLIKVVIALLDLGLITAAFYLAYWLRFDGLQGLESFIWLYYFSAPMILFLLMRNGVLTGFRYQRLRNIFTSTLKAFAIAGVASSTILYLSKTADYSRLVFGSYFLLAGVFVLLAKVMVKRIFDAHLKRGGMNIRVAMVGFGAKFEEIVRELRATPQWGIAPVLVIDPRTVDTKSIARSIRDSIIDEVYVAYPRVQAYHEQVDGLLEALEKFGMPVRVALNYDDLQEYYGQNVCKMGSKIGVMLAPYNLDPDQLILKRSIDLIGGILGLAVTALLLPFVALAVKYESPGPLFYSQIRIGKGGREFRIFKFRSMYVDAEQQKQELMQENIYQGPLFKVHDDPRVTKVGKILRKYSLDEFPQFWNVLKGDMSLVGTRPPTQDEVDQYDDHHFRRISIKPGLTGLWQVTDRNKVADFDEVVARDVEYIKNWNLMLDFKIIIRTVSIVLFPGRSGGI